MNKIFLILALTALHISAYEDVRWKQIENNYPLIPQDDWVSAEPYLIPLDHEAIGALDSLFSNPLVLANLESLQAAGFEVIRYRTSKKLVVARHPKLGKYLVKAYLEDYKHIELHNWVSRAKGSRIIQSVLDKNNVNHLFKVPKKWIYPIYRTEQVNQFHKNFILIVEDMELLSEVKCKKIFKEESTYDFLLKLHQTVVETGYSDCHMGNLPFSKDGKIAFIDLEYYNIDPVNLYKLGHFLTPEHKKFWDKLCSKQIH